MGRFGNKFGLKLNNHFYVVTQDLNVIYNGVNQYSQPHKLLLELASYVSLYLRSLVIMSTFVARSLIHLSLSRSYSFSVVSTPPRLLGYGPRIHQLASLKHVVVQ